MKNLLLFFCILLFVACSKKTEVIPEVANPILNLTLSIDTVHPGESVVINCSTENAVRTSNNFGAPTTTQWTHTLIPTQTTTLEVIAYNEIEKFVNKTKTITYVQWTLKDTMTNYLCSSPYKATKNEHEDTLGVWIEQGMTPLESRQLRLFNKNGTCKLWDPLGIGNTIENIPWWLTEDLKSLCHGGQTEEILLLNETTLILGYWVQALDPQSGQWVNSFRGRRTYTHQ